MQNEPPRIPSLWLWLDWTETVGQMPTVGLKQNQPQGRIHVLGLKHTRSAPLVLECLSGGVELGPVKHPVYLQIDLNRMPDLGWELLGLEPIQIPGLDSGHKRTSVQSRPTLCLPALE